MVSDINQLFSLHENLVYKGSFGIGFMWKYFLVLAWEHFENLLSKIRSKSRYLSSYFVLCGYVTARSIWTYALLQNDTNFFVSEPCSNPDYDIDVQNFGVSRRTRKNQTSKYLLVKLASKDKVEIKTKVYLITPNQLISDIGGGLGLFLGFSILSAFTNIYNQILVK